ncbi:MAG: hypothetical protein GX539_13870, partial [Candidatus Cloacimonetes bacterium]|nr:hypothetical protein [Candidatus Cloacimonadota bacterium]
MPRHEELPEALRGTAFHVLTGRHHGVRTGRMRGADLARPFHGVRVHGDDSSVAARCRALLPVMSSHQVFSHETAAELWRIPLPRSAEELHVTALGERGRMRRPGVRGWEREDGGLTPVRRGGIPVLTPADTWCSLASRVDERWLVAAGDLLISGECTDTGRTPTLCTRVELEEAVVRHDSRRGAGALRRALPRLRHPVDSPRETLLRLALVAGGLPEPEVQLAVRTSAGVLHGDLGYRDARLIIEYQGDEHRVSRRRWLRDLTRIQLLEDAGYRVILVGADDLRDGARPL